MRLRTFVMITIAMHYHAELVASSEWIEWWQVYHSSSQYRKWESWMWQEEQNTFISHHWTVTRTRNDLAVIKLGESWAVSLHSQLFHKSIQVVGYAWNVLFCSTWDWSSTFIWLYPCLSCLCWCLASLSFLLCLDIFSWALTCYSLITSTPIN